MNLAADVRIPLTCDADSLIWTASARLYNQREQSRSTHGFPCLSHHEFRQCSGQGIDGKTDLQRQVRTLQP
jgi:hypothetical protein